MEKKLFAFVGYGDNPVEAVDMAVGKVNEFLLTHQPSYVMSASTAVSPGEFSNWYVHVLHLYGPADETNPPAERGYTGKTERLA